MDGQPPPNWLDLGALLMGAPVVVWLWAREPDAWAGPAFLLLAAYCLGRGAGARHR